jgi:hypothetical protein
MCCYSIEVVDTDNSESTLQTFGISNVNTFKRLEKLNLSCYSGHFDSYYKNFKKENNE